MTETTKAELLLDQVLGALSGDAWAVTLDRLDVPAFVTDRDGQVTYWNRACVEFAGREPQLGRDRWCVLWKLHTTTGEVLPKDAPPMAVAIKEQRAIRNDIVIAQRADGSRLAFQPYVTPLFDESGGPKGAVNILIRASSHQKTELLRLGQRCQRLSKSVIDGRASRVLEDMAIGYERTAASLTMG